MDSEHLFSTDGYQYGEVSFTSDPDKEKSSNEDKVLFYTKTTGQRIILAIKLTSYPRKDTQRDETGHGEWQDKEDTR